MTPEFAAVAVVRSGVFAHLQSGVARASTSVLPRTTKEEPRK